MPNSPKSSAAEISIASPGRWATLACLLEASAPKPGNVHRGADFDDLTFVSLAASAVAIGGAMDAALPEGRVGHTIHCAVRAMRSACGSNAYLGTILLLAPLAHAAGSDARGSLKQVLSGLTPQDAADVYAAINHAQAGSLGTAAEHDLAGAPPESLMEAMRAAVNRDLVARQWAGGFEQVFEAAQRIEAARAEGLSLSLAIVHGHVRMMADYPDSLIARKCGARIATDAAGRAAGVLEAGPPQSDAYHAALADLDFWLRSDGHRRNPGTTADLIGAGIYVLLTRGRLPPPWE